MLASNPRVLREAETEEIKIQILPGTQNEFSATQNTEV